MDYSNEVFTCLARARESRHPTRLKGYYICSAITGCGNDFIKAAGKKTATCPICGREVERIQNLNDIDVQVLFSLWENCGTYSDVKADIKEERRCVV